MNVITKHSKIDNNEYLSPLSSFELKKYNGGGWITEGIAWIRGAFAALNDRIEEMSAERKADIIEEHGLRDHY